MITRILLYIKHNLSFIWSIIEWINRLLFKLLYYNKIDTSIHSVLSEYRLEGYEFRSINIDELAKLNNLITKQAKGRLDYFKPHNFDLKSLSIAYSNPSLIMMGVFLEKEMVGYFFLRCFWNKKCFVGRLIDQNHEGKGIGRVMNDIMYNIAWGEGFRCLSTISKSNQQVMRSHANNKRMVILKELPNDYLLVEFIKS